MLEHLKKSNDLGWVQPLAQLVGAATPLQEADEQLAAAVALAQPELAVCAALIELAEKQDEYVVRGDEVLRHARAWFGAEGDLVAALRRVSERGLVELLETPPTAVIRPAWSVMTFVTLQGRAAQEFGRMPIPSITSMCFALGLRSAVGPFERLAYGLGRASWTEIAYGLLEPRKPYVPVRAAASLGEFKPGLLARGRIGGRPLHCAARYDADATRNEAMRALSALRMELFGEWLQIDDVVAHPGETIASDRFLAAVERAAGRSINRSAGSRRVEFVLPAPLELEESMRLKAQTVSILRTLCSPREQTAADLREPIALHWLAGDDWLTEVAVRGAGEGAVRHSRVPRMETNDPFEIYRLVEAFDLAPSASIAAVHHAAGGRWSRKDPILAAISEVTMAMRAFNGTQRPRIIRFEADELEMALLQAREQALADAQVLTEAVPVLGEWRPAPTPEALYLVLVRAATDSELVFGEWSWCVYGAVPSDRGEEEVHIALIDPPVRDEDCPEAEGSPRDMRRGRAIRVMQAAFGGDAPAPVASSGDAQDLIAGLLGHADRDLRFVDDRFPEDRAC